MPFLRFSLVQLLLATMLVAIGAAGYKAIREEAQVARNWELHFFPDTQKLMVVSANRDELRIWDYSKLPARVRTVSVSKLVGDNNYGVLFHTLTANRIVIDSFNPGRSSDRAIVDVTSEKVVANFQGPSPLGHSDDVVGDYAIRRPMSSPMEVVHVPTNEIVGRRDLRSLNDHLYQCWISQDGRQFWWVAAHGELRTAQRESPESVLLTERKICDLETNDDAGGNWPYTACVSPNGRVVAYETISNGLRIYDSDGAILHHWNNTFIDIEDVHWSSDGRRIQLRTNYKYYVIDIDQKKIVYENETEPRLSGGMFDTYCTETLSPDGKLLAISSPYRLSLWDIDAGREIAVLGQTNWWRNFLVFWGVSSVWALLWGWERRRQKQHAQAASASNPLAGLQFGLHRYRHLQGCWWPVAFAIGLIWYMATISGWSLNISLPAIIVWVMIFACVIAFGSWWQRGLDNHSALSIIRQRLSSARGEIAEKQLGPLTFITVGQCELASTFPTSLADAETWASDYYGGPVPNKPAVLVVLQGYADFEAVLAYPWHDGYAHLQFNQVTCWLACDEFLRKEAVPLDLFGKTWAFYIVLDRYLSPQLPAVLTNINAQLALAMLDESWQYLVRRKLRQMRSWWTGEHDPWRLFFQDVHSSLELRTLDIQSMPGHPPDLAYNRLSEQYYCLFIALAAYLHADESRSAAWREMQRKLSVLETVDEESLPTALREHFHQSPQEFGAAWGKWLSEQPVFVQDPLEPVVEQALKEHVIPAITTPNVPIPHVITAIRAAASRGSLLAMPALIDLWQRRPSLADWIEWALECISGERHEHNPDAWQTAYQRLVQTEEHRPLAPPVENPAAPRSAAELLTPSGPATVPDPPPAMRRYWLLLIAGGIVKLGFATAYVFAFVPQLPVLVLAIIGLIVFPAVRLVVAGMSQTSDKELESLRSHQGWSWLYGDLINVALWWVESTLNRRADVQIYRTLMAKA